MLLTSLLAVAASALAAGAAAADELLLRPGGNGEFTGWKSFHEAPATATADVWKWDAEGVLVCRGTPKGYLYTERDYADLSLAFEWRWPPGGKAGNGGLLQRLTGDHRIWPRSLEVQLNSGRAGDFWGLAGYPLAGPAERLERIDHQLFGRLTHLEHTQALERPAGEWNRVEVELSGEVVTVKINGQLVNRASGCELVAGKVALTAEGAEIHFRNFRLHCDAGGNAAP